MVAKASSDSFLVAAAMPLTKNPAIMRVRFKSSINIPSKSNRSSWLHLNQIDPSRDAVVGEIRRDNVSPQTLREPISTTSIQG